MSEIKESCQISSREIDDAYDELLVKYNDLLAINAALQSSMNKLLAQLSAQTAMF